MNLLEKVSSLAKRRGFIYPGSEIYGGLAGFWDYGPLGVELKNNIKKIWWKDMVYSREDVLGIDAAIIMNPEVWKVSGHLEAFTDPLVECKNCHARFRADHFAELQDRTIEEKYWLERWQDFYKSKRGNQEPNSQSAAKKAYYLFKSENKILCPCCTESHEFTDPKLFNLLTEVYLGTTEPKQKAYLRGEITQGVFVNFQNIVKSTRVKIPFGVAQIGKAFRNEITPGNFTFRSREFEQMELEYFIPPDDKKASETFEYWKKERLDWYIKLGISEKNLRFRDHEEKERAHYARFATDIEYNSPFGWKEFEGIHHRGDWDLSRHGLVYKDPETKKEYVPWVIEISGGVDRAVLFFLLDAYREEKERVILSLHPQLSPYKVAVFPLLSNKEELIDKARNVFEILSKDFYVAWDDRGNIGKRYFSQDEIGTPWCVTIDFQSLKDDSVTIRDRDTKKQERVSIAKLEDWFNEKL